VGQSGDDIAQSGGGSPALGAQKASTSEACRSTGGENDQRRAGTLQSKKAPASHQIHGRPYSSSSSPRHPDRAARGKAAKGHWNSMRQRTYSRSSRRHRPPPRHPTMGPLRSTTRTTTRLYAWGSDAEELTGTNLETEAATVPPSPVTTADQRRGSKHPPQPRQRRALFKDPLDSLHPMDDEADDDPTLTDLAQKIQRNPCRRTSKIGTQPKPTLYRAVTGTFPPSHSTGNAGKLSFGSGRRAGRSTQLQ
jgi:hypothetical protein